MEGRMRMNFARGVICPRRLRRRLRVITNRIQSERAFRRTIHRAREPTVQRMRRDARDRKMADASEPRAWQITWRSWLGI